MPSTTPPSLPGYDLTDDMEIAVVRQIFADSSLLPRLAKHIRPERFSNQSVQRMVRLSVGYFQRFGSVPSRVTIVQEVANLRSSGQGISIEEAADFIERCSSAAPIDSRYVLERVMEVERREATFSALEEATRAYRRGDYDAMLKLAERVHAIGRIDTTPASDYRKGLAARTDRRKKGPPARWGVGIPAVDDLINNGIAPGELGTILGLTKGGKCHAKGQGILMHDGSVKRVEDVVVGDVLMGVGGQPRRVLSTNRGRGQMFEIRPRRRGKPWRVNEDHILTLARTGRGNAEWIDVPLREWLGWTRSHKHFFKLVHSRIDEFGGGDRTRSLDPYFLGLLIGDGSMKYRVVEITTADTPIVEESRRQAEAHGLRLKLKGPRGAARSYGFSGTMGKANPIAQKLAALGLRGSGSGTKFIPDAYRLAPREDRLALLAGLIDTDGHLSVNERGHCKYEYVTKSKRLADDVMFVARSLGFRSQVISCEKGCQTGAVGTYFRLNISGPIGEIPCRVVRKVPGVRAGVGMARDPLKVGFSVRRAGVEDFYGFSLDGDARYLLDDFTITHNSLALGHIASYVMSTGGFVAYFTTEMSENDITDRQDAAVSRTPFSDLWRDPDAIFEKVARWLSRVAGACRVKKIPKFSTTRDIEAGLDELRLEHGTDPDVVIVDYADELNPNDTSRYDKRHEELVGVYTDLKDAAERRKNRWWTASQAKISEALQKRNPTIADLAGASGKAFIADLILALARTDEETRDGYVRFVVAACRFAAGGGASTEPLPSAFGMGRIVLDCPWLDG